MLFDDPVGVLHGGSWISILLTCSQNHFKEEEYLLLRCRTVKYPPYGLHVDVRSLKVLFTLANSLNSQDRIFGFIQA
jgi:hypothetical protein